MKRQQLLQHLLALRLCVIKSLIAWLAVTTVLFCFRESLFIYLTQPLMHWLPRQSQFIATGAVTVLTTPLKLVFISGLLGAMPLILYQIWRFIFPGLYPAERRVALRVLLGSVGLFSLGLLFCFWVVLPFIFQLIVQVVPDNVLLLPDIQQYVQFCLQLLLAFGVIFQLPLMVWIVAQLGWLTVAQLTHYRPYVLVMAFVIGMLLTPPDVISQILLAIPLWLLFEVSIVMLRWRDHHA